MNKQRIKDLKELIECIKRVDEIAKKHDIKGNIFTVYKEAKREVENDNELVAVNHTDDDADEKLAKMTF